MYVTRKFGDVEICVTLTKEELMQAYRLQQDLLDLEDVRNYIEENGEDLIGEAATKDILDDEFELMWLAQFVRRHIHDNGDGWSELLISLVDKELMEYADDSDSKDKESQSKMQEVYVHV